MFVALIGLAIKYSNNRKILKYSRFHFNLLIGMTLSLIKYVSIITNYTSLYYIIWMIYKYWTKSTLLFSDLFKFVLVPYVIALVTYMHCIEAHISIQPRLHSNCLCCIERCIYYQNRCNYCYYSIENRPQTQPHRSAFI